MDELLDFTDTSQQSEEEQEHLTSAEVLQKLEEVPYDTKKLVA